jgi:hypothetical protein
VELASGLEGDNYVCDAGHGVCGLSVDSEIVVLPEDIWFIFLRSIVEGRGVRL